MRNNCFHAFTTKKCKGANPKKLGKSIGYIDEEYMTIITSNNSHPYQVKFSQVIYE